MATDLNIRLRVGDVIRYRYRDGIEYRLLTNRDGTGRIMPDCPPGVDVVYEGVLKQDVFHIRKVINAGAIKT